MNLGDELGTDGLGTGILISPNLVLTAAHNIWYRDQNRQFESFQFFPGAFGSMNKNKAYNCSVFYYPPEHKTSPKTLYDYALLQLNEPIFEGDEFLRLSTSLENSDLATANTKTLAIFGYPESVYSYPRLSSYIHQKGDKKSNAVVELDQKKGEIKYQLSTMRAQSGAPIIEIAKEGEK